VQDVRDVFFLIRGLVTVAEHGLGWNSSCIILQRKKHITFLVDHVGSADPHPCSGVRNFHRIEPSDIFEQLLFSLQVVTFLAFVQENKSFGNFFQDQSFALINPLLTI